jgi:hypothetical protein
MEYIIIVAFLIAVLTPVFFYAFDSSSMSIRTARSREVVESLALAADNLFSMGGGRTSVYVYIPYGAEYSRIQNRTILLGMRVDGSVSEAFATTLCNVTGEIPTDEGYARIFVTMFSNGTVQVG